MKKVLTIIFAGLVTVGLASADITPAIVNVTGSGPDYTWNYEISVDGLENLVGGISSCTAVTSTTCVGSYFTIYDFTDYVTGSISAPAGWSDSVQASGITPGTQNPPDAPTLENLTFYYTGAGVTGPTTTDITGFSAESTLSSVAETNGYFSYQATNAPTGGLDQGVGRVEVPTATPEPVTTGLIGLALVGMAVARRKFAR